MQWWRVFIYSILVPEHISSLLITSYHSRGWWWVIDVMRKIKFLLSAFLLLGFHLWFLDHLSLFLEIYNPCWYLISRWLTIALYITVLTSWAGEGVGGDGLFLRHGILCSCKRLSCCNGAKRCLFQYRHTYFLSVICRRYDIGLFQFLPFRLVLFLQLISIRKEAFILFHEWVLQPQVLLLD